jgi:hypothetical protein
MPVFFQMLSKSEAEQLVVVAHLYGLKRHHWFYLDLYKEIMWAHGIRRRELTLLGSIVEEAKKDLKLHQGSMVKDGEQRFGAAAHGAVHGQGGKIKIEAAPGVLNADGWRQITKNESNSFLFDDLKCQKQFGIYS